MARLTAKQTKFVEVYAGNGTQAARLAGYKGSDNVLAQVAFENLRKPEIATAIKARQATESAPLIASRQERQAFWTGVMKDPEREMYSRLKASELLGKSEADFIERQRHEGAGGRSVRFVIDLGPDK